MSETSLTLVDLTQVEVRRKRQHGPGVWIEAPAMAEFTGLATRRLAKASFAAGLGTGRPTHVVLMTNPDQTAIYLIPTSEHPKALPVRYTNSGAVINLSKLFTHLGRSVASGIREFHTIDLVEGPITFEDKEHWSLVMPLQHTATKRIRRVSASAPAPTHEAAREIAATEQ